MPKTYKAIAKSLANPEDIEEKNYNFIREILTEAKNKLNSYDFVEIIDSDGVLYGTFSKFSTKKGVKGLVLTCVDGRKFITKENSKGELVWEKLEN